MKETNGDLHTLAHNLFITTIVISGMGIFKSVVLKPELKPD